MMTDMEKYKVIKKVCDYRSMPWICTSFGIEKAEWVSLMWLRLSNFQPVSEVHLFRTVHIAFTQMIGDLIKKAKTTPSDRADSIISDETGEIWVAIDNSEEQYQEEVETHAKLVVSELIPFLSDYKALVIQLYFGIIPIEKTLRRSSNDDRWLKKTPTQDEISQWLFDNGYKDRILTRQAINDVLTTALEELKAVAIKNNIIF